MKEKFIVKIRYFDSLIISNFIETMEQAEKIKNEFNELYGDGSFDGAYISSTIRGIV